VIETSDARYAEISREMFKSGDYLHPTLLGIKHYHKPPLTYYITSVGYSLFGITPFGARFFIQLAILVQLVFVYLLSFELFGERKTAIWAALIYFSFPIVLISSRNLTTDPYLTTFVILSMFFWVKYRKSASSIYLYMFAICLALGFLTKGPLIFIVPLVFVAAYNLTEPPKAKFNLHHIFSGIIFMIIAGSWFYLLIRQNPDLISYFAGYQTVDRFITDTFGRSEPFWYYFLIAPGAGFPWLIILPFIFWKNRKEIIKTKQYLVLSAGITIPFLFFSIASSKLVPYILPLFPLFAILIAQMIRQFGLNKIYFYIILGYAVLLPVSGFLSSIIPVNLNIPLSVALLSLGSITASYLIYKSNKADFDSKPVNIVFAVSLFLLISSGFVMSKNQLQINSTQPLADFIQKSQLDTNEILVYNRRLPSISFNLQKPIISLYDGNTGLNREVQFEENENWKQNLVNLKNETELAGLKQTLDNNPTILIVYKNRLPENRRWLLDYYHSKKDFIKWQIYY
jgi:4-amino-4-deoxy-L-arabinose transferase